MKTANVIEMPRKPNTSTESEEIEIPPREELIRRARFICALGRFTRLDERTMVIESEEIGEFETKTIVRRKDKNILVCNCPVYLSATGGTKRNLLFLCEHKLALKSRASLPKIPKEIYFNPVAKTIETMIGVTQRQQLKQLARDLEILDCEGKPEIDKIAWQRLGCEAGDLSGEAAQFLIDYLLEVLHFENSSNSGEMAPAA